jgi:hypothetical protein
MPTIREVVVGPDDNLGMLFKLTNKSRKDGRRFFVRSIEPTSSVCFDAGIREDDELLTAASVMASTFENVEGLDEFLDKKRWGSLTSFLPFQFLVR